MAGLGARLRSNPMADHVLGKPELVRVMVLAVLAYVFFAATERGFASLGNLFTIMEGLVFLGLPALAFGFTMIAGELDLAVPATGTVAAVLAIQYANRISELPPGLVLAVVLLLGVAVGLLIGVLQGLLVWSVGLHSVVITLGTSAALIGLATLMSGTATIAISNLDLSVLIQQRILRIFSPASFIAVALFLLAGLFLHRTRWGIEIRSIGGGRNEAVAAGVPLWRPTVLVFVISGALSAVFGVLVSMGVGSINPLSFRSLLLQAVAAALIGGVSLYGGRGTALGIAIGTFTLRFVRSGMNLGGRPSYAIEMAIGLLLLFVVVLDLASNKGGMRRLLAGLGEKIFRRPAGADMNNRGSTG